MRYNSSDEVAIVRGHTAAAMKASTLASTTQLQRQVIVIMTSLPGSEQLNTRLATECSLENMSDAVIYLRFLNVGALACPPCRTQASHKNNNATCSESIQIVNKKSDSSRGCELNTTLFSQQFQHDLNSKLTAYTHTALQESPSPTVFTPFHSKVQHILLINFVHE